MTEKPNKPPSIRIHTGFTGPLAVESIDPNTWALLTDLTWVGTQGDSITVSAGEETDFASVPQILQSLVARTGAWTKAAVIHDMLCRLLNEWHKSDLEVGLPVFNAVDTDAIFEKIMVEDGVPRWKASLLWAAVRAGAAANPARREAWWSTFPRFARIAGSALIVALAALAGLASLAALVIPW